MDCDCWNLQAPLPFAWYLFISVCINPSQLLLQLLFPKRFDIWRWSQNCAAELRFGGLHHGGGHPGCDRGAITTAVIIPKRSVNHHHLYIYIYHHFRCFFPHDSFYNPYPLSHGFQGEGVRNVSYNFGGTPQRGKIL